MAGVVGGKGRPGRPRKKTTHYDDMKANTAERKAAEREAHNEALKRELMDDKDATIDAVYDLPIPDDGLDHEKWSPPARVLARLLSDPEFHGRTDKEIGLSCGLNPRTVKWYKMRPDFMDYAAEVATKTYASLGPVYLVQALLALLKSGKPGRAIELYLKEQGRLIERKQVDGKMTIENTHKSVEEMLEEALELEKKALESGLH